MPVIVSELSKAVLVTNYFFRVRIEAAKALVLNANANEHLGLFHLLKIYQSRYCYPPEVETMDPFQFTCIPRPNEFSDFAEHLVQKVSLILACGPSPWADADHTPHSFIQPRPFLLLCHTATTGFIVGRSLPG